MALSVLDLHPVGIGPSSSHAVGPTRAARRFVRLLERDGLPGDVAGVAELYGSLGATGRGHGSDKAVVLGPEGEDPATVDTDRSGDRVAQVRAYGTRRRLGYCRASPDFRPAPHSGTTADLPPRAVSRIAAQQTTPVDST